MTVGLDPVICDLRPCVTVKPIAALCADARLTPRREGAKAPRDEVQLIRSPSAGVCHDFTEFLVLFFFAPLRLRALALIGPLRSTCSCRSKRCLSGHQACPIAKSACSRQSALYIRRQGYGTRQRNFNSRVPIEHISGIDYSGDGSDDRDHFLH